MVAKGAKKSKLKTGVGVPSRFETEIWKALLA